MNIGTSTYSYGNLQVQVTADEWDQFTGIIKEVLYHQEQMCPLCDRELDGLVNVVEYKIVHALCLTGIVAFLRSTANYLAITNLVRRGDL